MAVKVMLAPAIAQRDANPPDRKPGEPRPRRRRSSVYDADGNEVFITLVCLKCHKTRPLAQFGLRKMADGAIRNQPWCRTCRGAAGADKPRHRSAQGEGEALEGAAIAERTPAPPASAPVVDAGTLAAQVVAALHGGRR